jgi:hypothetical protein
VEKKEENKNREGFLGIEGYAASLLKRDYPPLRFFDARLSNQTL